MMVDRGMVESVYLPWLMSVINGNMKPGALSGDKKEFTPVAYSFEKETFAMGGRTAAMAMDGAEAGSVAVVPIIGEF